MEEELAAQERLRAELEAIQQRLATLVGEGASGAALGPELGQIRAHLRQLAEEHDEIQRRLAPLFSDAPKVD